MFFTIKHIARGMDEHTACWYLTSADRWTRLHGEAKPFTSERAANAKRTRLAKVYYADELHTVRLPGF